MEENLTEINTSGRPTSHAPQAFRLKTIHGTEVGFFGNLANAKLVHDLPGSRPAYLICLDDRCSIGVVLDTALTCEDHPGKDAPRQTDQLAIPFEIRWIEPHTTLALWHPRTSAFLSARLGEYDLCIDRSSAGGWEYFSISPISKLEQDFFEAMAGSMFGMNSDFPIVSMLRRPTELGLAVAEAMIWLLDEDSLRKQIADLSQLDSYGKVFPSLQRRLSGGRIRFEFQVNERLASQIARFGWKIGDHSYGNPDIIEPHLGMLAIGKYCSMNDFTIVLGNHMTNTVSSYPFAELSKYWPTASSSNSLEDHLSKDVSIGNDVWIGRGALVLPGTIIGDGAVIGAHAVARGKVPPYAVVVGNPGRVIRFRFESNLIDRLLRLKWWDWPDHIVDRFIPLILNPDITHFLSAAESLPIPPPVENEPS